MGSKAFAVGKTKIFFKSGCLEYLESQRGEIWYTLAVTVQDPTRGFLTRTRLDRERKAEEERIWKEKNALKIAEEERIAKKKLAEQEEEERIWKEKNALKIAEEE